MYAERKSWNIEAIHVAVRSTRAADKTQAGAAIHTSLG